MIRSTNHSSFPRIGESPLDQQLRRVLAKREHGAATDADVDEVVDEVIGLVVAEQSRAFVDLVTDGLVRWDGPQACLAGRLDGIQPGPLARWFDTNFYQRRLEVVGEVRHREPFLVRDFLVASAVAPSERVKVVLPGPVTTARLARDRHYGAPAALARALATALAAEAAALAGAGARCFQLDEPLLATHPEDFDLVCETSAQIFSAAAGATLTVLSTYFGELTALAGRLGDLPGTHLGLDLAGAPANAALLARLDPAKGLALGVFDARTTLQEDAADVAAALGPYREALTCRDVIVGPNAGLELLPRDQAFDKLLHARYLVEKLSEEWTWD